MPDLNVRLPPAVERFLAAQVKEGVYRSREAAIIAAVSTEMRRTERRALLQAQLQNGLDSRSADELDIEGVIRRGRVRRAARYEGWQTSVWIERSRRRHMG